MSRARCRAEWEHQETVWLAWPHNQKHWGERLTKLREFYIELIKCILEFQPVDLIIPDVGTKEFVKKEIVGGKFPITYHQMKTDDLWIRDYGPFFFERDGVKGGVNFVFNAWGEKYPPWESDNAIAKKILHCKHFEELPSSVVTEGGNIEINSSGMMLTIEECFFASGRNPSLKRVQFYDWCRENIGVDTLLWLPRGLECDHTDGHVDNIVRFIDDSTVLLFLPPKGHKEYSRMKENADFLKGYEVLTVVECPFIPQRKWEGETLPSSYINFIFVNGAVIIPAYGAPEDAKAFALFEGLFPNRIVKSINISTLITEGGGLHCMTRNG
ncbi:MAG: agmatine deiminase family protein [Fibrobacterales bacterium]